ncbi:LuxR C-terminal-related transcriptional regulator [Pseudosporangium ferrugineum]|uniref:LuxR family maltose regulon positive regulatory protein n=1 Tax=Pseudosporangium ferrugineum TaxID=439699 RepID=A0A2T0SBR5_9ACTN|nr:LuxR C-terminal-related transcriptional regulator [Pseudosporangium ferrugineum]PRY30858.1 LuxR family maltose regulon positive regulatory protein [Pseudosporangium ferrugineum]
MVRQDGDPTSVGGFRVASLEPVPAPPKPARAQPGRSNLHRPRLTDLLDSGASGMVTLVSAGAGWGKTTLVSAWAATRREPVGWLTLESHDNDPRVFSAHVVAALRAASGAADGWPAAQRDAVLNDGIGRIRALGRMLSQLPLPMVLVLDDFDTIDNPRLLRELGGILRVPRDPFRLVLISRTEPALPLHRLRAAGELSEVRTHDLAFTADEAVDLLAAQGVRLPAEEIALLVRRTEGWAAGLQLAARFITGPDGGSVADFSGDVRPVDEYLSEEVLARQNPRFRAFLLRTSICEHLCGDLADAVTQDSGGQRILEELEQVNQLVVRLDSHPYWFRYHHLIRDVLQHRLRLESPELLPQLHRRAADWYAGKGMVIDALGHAIAARDWGHLGRLVVEAAPMILSRDRSRLVEVLKRVPAAELAGTAELMICGAILLFDAGDYAGIRERLREALGLLADRTDTDRRPAEIAVRALRAAANRAAGDMPAVIRDSTSQLSDLARVPVARLPSTLQYRAIALHNKGVALLWTGQLEAAERYLSRSSVAARTAGVPLAEINALGHHALLEVMSGSVREAERLVCLARHRAERGGWTDSVQVVAAHLAASVVELERSRYGPAERALQLALRAHRGDPEAAQWKLTLGIEARLAMAQDRLPNAQAFLREARRRRYPDARTPAIDRWLLALESEADLLADRPELVQRRYGSQLRSVGLTLPERNLLVRAALATRNPDAAQTLLTERGSLMSETVATVEARVLGALTADAIGRGVAAGELLGKAVVLAAAEEIRRPFARLAGGRLGSLLARQSLMTGDHAAFVADLLQLIGGTTVPDDIPAGVVALSGRETEVLHYLPTMLTAAEIGVELGVSVNTIKAHMRAIYRKLGTPRRRQAVSRAREYGLI